MIFLANIFRRFVGLTVVAGLLLIAVGCAKKEDNAPVTPDEEIREDAWRYFDREVYFPTGVSVAPEMAAAQELVQEALRELETQTDLGVDYFIFKTEEDSILQPVVGEETYQGRNWRSFWQIWDDELFNDFVAENLGTPSDQDIVVSRNEKNDREFYVITRLSCFVAGEGCLFPTQGQTKMLAWRAVGYLVGLRFGDNAASEIMRSGVSPAQDSDAARRTFAAEMNGALERVRNEIPPPL